jgi:hypothetical protein
MRKVISFIFSDILTFLIPYAKMCLLHAAKIEQL